MRAVRLCLKGDVVNGASLYREALATHGGHLVPVGVHVDLLRQSGHIEAAASIQRAGLLLGADLSTVPLDRGIDPAVAVKEYESLFLSGIATTQMVARYMVGLSLTGQADALRALAAPDLLFQHLPLAISEPVGPYLEEVGAALLTSDRRQFQAVGRSIRHMDRVEQVHASTDPVMVALHDAVRSSVAAYQQRVADSTHMLATLAPHEFTLRSWGVVSDGAGYNTPHIHPGCWTVAVAYIEAGPDAGHLRVGPYPGGDARCPGWPVLDVTPTPGTVVIMPAFYTHWTLPSRAVGRRISVAFNVCEALDPADPDGMLIDAIDRR